ncbi:MAG: alcohol dehydrogenase, partial [Gammaproteobacteria bacterium]|nr:alcohol dehydrogenase [Gammaproteobacteria bacterium]
MSIPTIMKAVVTLGHGDYTQLSYQEHPVPEIEPHEVLLKVLAAGVNNTEINTRLGWYSASISKATAETGSQQSHLARQQQDGGWDG